MNVEKLLAIMQQLAALGGAVAELVAEGSEALASSDEAKLKQGLADLEARNQATYARVREKLAAAAEKR